MRRLIVVLCLLCGGAIAFGADAVGDVIGPSSAPHPSHALSARPLLKALRGGGYTLYFRHTSTDFSKLDGNMKHYRDCANQRMLSDKGRAEARDIGKAIAALRIPVGEVLASPYCRTTETATLMFGRATGANEIREEADNNYAALKRLLAKPVAARPRVSDVVNKKVAKFTIDTLVNMLSRVGKPVKLAVG